MFAALWLPQVVWYPVDQPTVLVCEKAAPQQATSAAIVLVIFISSAFPSNSVQRACKTRRLIQMSGIPPNPA